MYKLKSKVEILNLSNEFVVAAFNHEKFLSIEGAKDELGYTTKYNEDHVLLDPRNKKLGGRIIANLEKLYMSLKKMKLKSSNIDEYYKLSFELGIPQSNMDQLQEKLFGIECNFVELNAIDFKKGCYVGQEVIARLDTYDKVQRSVKVLESKSPLVKGAKLTSGSKLAGIVTSPSSLASLDGRYLSLALVRKAFCKTASVVDSQGISAVVR